MKKLLSLFLVSLVFLSLVACNKKDVKTYEGSAKGYKSEIKVEVKIADGNTLSDVKVTKHEETEGIGSKAVEKLPPLMVSQQKVDVDVLTGATFTSKGIIEAVKDAFKKANLDPKDLKANADGKKDEKVEKLEVDVVVIGAGGAGLTAAIELANNNKKVILLEKNEIAGGNSVKSTGGMNAAETKYQKAMDLKEFKEEKGIEKTIATAREKYPELKELADKVEKQFQEYLLRSDNKGYFDSVDLFILDTLIGGKNLNNHKLVEVLAKESADGIEWLEKNGAKLSSVGSFGGASVKRIHRPVNAEGKTIAVGSYIVPILTKNVENNKNIKIIYGAPANELIVADGKISGVKAKGYEISAKAVIIASGGFGYNLEMVEKYKPELKGFISTNSPGITGDGIVMAEKIGAKLVDMNQIQIHPTVFKETSSLITEGLRGDGAILVNQEGKRFVDEVGTRDAVSAAEIAQTGSYAYLIIDQKMYDASNVIQGYVKKEMAVKGESIKDLAKALKIDEKTFEETMNKWNKSVSDGSDPEFNRTSFAKPLDTAPFYAIKVTPGVHHTMGGIAINEKAEVLDTKDQPIVGLYAAGEVTGGVHGANRLGGNAVADFIVFGRVAARTCLEYLK